MNSEQADACDCPSCRGMRSPVFKSPKPSDDIPRRCFTDKLSLPELAIFEAMRSVEALPGDVRLTDAVCLLQAARDSVADYIDKIAEVRRLVVIVDAVEPSCAIPVFGDGVA